MSSVHFKTALGGAVTVSPTDTASNLDILFPAAGGTLLTSDGVKTINGESIVGTGDLLVSGGGVLSIKNFGAHSTTEEGYDTFDSTTAIKNAVASLPVGGSLYIPAGDYLVKDTIPCTNPIAISGDGMGVSVITFSPPSARTLFDFSLDVSLDKPYTLRELSLIATEKDCGTAIKVVGQLTAAATQVNGENDALIVETVKVTCKSGGYWTIGAHVKHVGGTHFDRFTVDNTTGEANQDNDTVGIYLECADTRMHMIRTLALSDFYFVRMAVAIKIAVIPGGSIESVYVTKGEILAQNGLVVTANTSVGALFFSEIHFDVNNIAIDTYNGTYFTHARFVGCDFRKGDNGGTLTNAPTVRIGKGEMVVFSGCQFSGAVPYSPLLPDKTQLCAIDFRTYDGTFPVFRASVTGCVIKEFYDAFIIPHYAKVTFAANTYDSNTGVVFNTLVDPGAVHSKLKDAYTAFATIKTVAAVSSQNITVDLPTGMLNGKWPVALMMPSFSTGMVISYNYDASTSTTAVFTIVNSSESGAIRFFVMASAQV